MNDCNLGYIRYFLALLLPFLLTSCDSNQKLNLLTNNSVILAFGDSLTFGTGVQKENSYPSVLAKRLNMTVINAGIPGEVSADGLKRLPSLLSEHQPQLVILCHGGNDILRRFNKDIPTNNLRQMIQLIQAQGRDVLLVGVPEFGLFPSAAPYYKSLSEEFQLASELSIIPDLQTQARYKSDAVHFNEAGYGKLADAIYTVIENSNAIQ